MQLCARLDQREGVAEGAPDLFEQKSYIWFSNIHYTIFSNIHYTIFSNIQLFNLLEPIDDPLSDVREQPWCILAPQNLVKESWQ